MNKQRIRKIICLSVLTVVASRTPVLGAQSISGLYYERSMDLQYAECFSVDYYEDGYKLISIQNEKPFLVVPEGKPVPEHEEEEFSVLQQPLDRMYLVATSAMDFFVQLDAVDALTLSGTKADGWYIPEAKQAMEKGNLVYAGKYNAPDYERIVSSGCSLAIESTMIYHNPEVKEKLEAFDIPVLTEHSSYESHPLGRSEWIKLYAALLNREDEAEKIFAGQTEKLDAVLSDEKTDQTVAFFYINSKGYANVRKSGDYVSRMIDLAGGTYVFPDLGDDDALSTMNMQMEDFYAGAKDADVIIYNSTIDGEMSSVGELLEKSPLLADFRSVEEGQVWCTTQNLFQRTTGLADMIEDIHRVLTEQDVPDTLTYLYRLK